MKLLLDTHIWLWSLLEPEKLSRRVLRELENTSNELWLSPISTWEVLLLCEKNRLVVNEDTGTWIAKALNAVGLREAPLTHDVATESRSIQLPHRDPADKFLAATAKVFDLTLVTGDRNLIGAKGISVLANR
jgi:PIN domain nuclease of toxin-antitoxin system